MSWSSLTGKAQGKTTQILNPEQALGMLAAPGECQGAPTSTEMALTIE